MIDLPKIGRTSDIESSSSAAPAQPTLFTSTALRLFMSMSHSVAKVSSAFAYHGSGTSALRKIEKFNRNLVLFSVWRRRKTRDSQRIPRCPQRKRIFDVGRIPISISFRRQFATRIKLVRRWVHGVQNSSC